METEQTKQEEPPSSSAVIQNEPLAEAPIAPATTDDTEEVPAIVPPPVEQSPPRSVTPPPPAAEALSPPPPSPSAPIQSVSVTQTVKPEQVEAVTPEVVEAHDPPLPPLDPGYLDRCPICQVMFASDAQVCVHMIAQHKQFVCCGCGYHLETQVMLREHQAEMHSSYHAKWPYRCSYCGADFLDKKIGRRSSQTTYCQSSNVNIHILHYIYNIIYITHINNIQIYNLLVLAAQKVISLRKKNHFYSIISLQYFDLLWSIPTYNCYTNTKIHIVSSPFV